MNIKLEDIKKAIDDSMFEHMRRGAHIKMLKHTIKGVTLALIESGGWGLIGTEEFECPDCGCRNGNHSASDCELFKIYEAYLADSKNTENGTLIGVEAEQGREG